MRIARLLRNLGIGFNIIALAHGVVVVGSILRTLGALLDGRASAWKQLGMACLYGGMILGTGLLLLHLAGRIVDQENEKIARASIKAQKAVPGHLAHGGKRPGAR